MDDWTIGFTLLAISLIALGVWAVLRYGSDERPFDLQARLGQLERPPAAPYKVEPKKSRPPVRAVSVPAPKSAAAMKPRRKRQA